MIHRPATLAWGPAAALAATLATALTTGLARAADAPPIDAPSWFVFLETGRPTPADPPAVQAMQRGHIDNFKRLFALGQLQAAGPMADPARLKRGIVVLRAHSLADLQAYFQPDDYVREGYMTLNAVPATARQPLHTTGIDASKIEEVRIALLPRPEPDTQASQRLACLQARVAAGTVGAWYTLHEGPLAEVLLARGTDTTALEAALAPCNSPAPQVWRQWISPGVVGPR